MGNTKKILLLVAICFMFSRGFSQPIVNSPSFPSTVGLFDLFEVSFTLGDTYSNPYDPDIISIKAAFISPEDSVMYAEAFYYEDYEFQKNIVGSNPNYYYEAVSDSLLNVGWRIRFTPTSTGIWRFRIIARDSTDLMTQMPNNGTRYYTFSCTSVDDGDGFISKANSRYLKRDVVKNGVRQFRSFFPIGPNIAWYSCRDYGTFKRPLGIYEYEKYIDSLSGNANYMRIWINRYQYLSLYGPEYTHRDSSGNPVVYFDKTINQKDSAELDHIITYALQHGISIMPCIFTYGDFTGVNNMEPSDPSVWENNPYSSLPDMDGPCDFFRNKWARKVTKQLIRYIVSRWGYATNIMAWELWNEIDNVFHMCESYKHIEQDAIAWHEEMTYYIKSIDTYNHCITTSMASANLYPYLFSSVFTNLDFVQQHNYQSIQNAESRKQFSYILLNKTNGVHSQYPSKPFFMGEFGFDQTVPPSYASKDPYGIDLHNSLWSSLFSSSIGPASFWWWQYIDSKRLYNRFKPILNFCENLPILSETFTGHQTGTIVGNSLVFDNNIENYYIINSTEDTIFGWCQDTSFAYQSLRWLTDSSHWISTDWGPALMFDENGVFDPSGYVYTMNPSKKPQPSSNSNVITITNINHPVGTRYTVKWYSAESGQVYYYLAPYAYVQQNASGEKYISFTFPSFIRNISQHSIGNSFGDVVFSLILKDVPSQKQNN